MNGSDYKNLTPNLTLNNQINGKHSFLLEYYNKSNLGFDALGKTPEIVHDLVAAGDIVIIGHELKQELSRLIEELDSDKYIYDQSEATLRINFIETFCKHTKSPFYGVKFKLELWEKAVIEAFYSFKWKESDLRRFKKCLLLIARKNGKSTLCAAIALSELMLNIGGVDIVCSSNDDAQADIIFQEVNNMREQFDPYGRRTHKNLKGIFNLRNKSTIKKLSDRTKNKEGRNIDYGFIDEVHEMTTNVIAKSIEQSQSTKDESGLWEVTTEGFVNDGFLDAELKYARKVSEGKVYDPTLLVWLYSQDNEVEIWQDPKTHYKSNPSLGLIKKKEYLKEQIRKAQQSQSDRIFTLAKDFNVKQNNASAWLMSDDFQNEATYKMEDFKGCVAVAGVDLADTTDLACAKVLIIKPGSGVKFIITKYFIPESKLTKGEEQDKKDYKQWAKEGLIEVSPGNENDFRLITKWFVSLYKTWGIKFFKIGYDNAMAKYWVNEMEDIGFDLDRILQTPDGMSEAMKLLEEDLKSKYVNYNNNPMDRWCYSNTAIKVNNRGQMMPIKVEDNRTKRIDGTVANIIAVAVYLKYRSDYLNLVR